MDVKTAKKHNEEFIRYFPLTAPTMGWYFSSILPPNPIELPSNTWTCMFKHLQDVINGEKLCFSQNASGCSGASCYFGFTKPHENAGSFLAQKEKFKEKRRYGNEFYRQIEAKRPKEKYLILSKLVEIEDDISVEVINFWVTPSSLSGLVTLSNFDSPENNNVIIPFASGCQSMWTIPYKEKTKKKPKATIGALDPAMRKYINNDSLLFSVPANRFAELARNINSSFAVTSNWLDLVAK